MLTVNEHRDGALTFIYNFHAFPQTPTTYYKANFDLLHVFSKMHCTFRYPHVHCPPRHHSNQVGPGLSIWLVMVLVARVLRSPRRWLSFGIFEAPST